MSSVFSMKQDNGKRETRDVWNFIGSHMALSLTYRISTALMSSIGNIHISNKKQSYNMNTVTWHNNTCNMNGDLYDKNRETIHACVTVICRESM